MAEPSDLVMEEEIISNELKVALNEWKEIIVLLNAILAWKNNWFPVILVFCVTSIYLFMWLINYSIFNVIWTVGIFVTLLDYFVCGPFQNMLLPNSWDQDKEQTYTVFIKSVTDFYVTLKLYIKRFFKLRRTNSNLFHCLLLVSFVSLLYIGTIFNNIFLSYISVLVTLLFPGYKMRSEFIKENFQKYGGIIISYFWTKISKIIH